MKVSDIMTHNVDYASPSDSVQTVSERMRDENIGVVPVFENDQPVGLITDRDITIRAVAEGKDPVQTKVSEIMTHEVIFCMENMDVEDAVRIMEYKKIRRLLVKNEFNEFTGILSIGDVAMSMTIELTGEVLQEVTGTAFPQR
ncbi:MAG TPA: CBS domain-containing protein [Chitinispirillaceae bacterium]|nr:CBS domain-containing protein [Chitinispirillaceae bacterium]